MNVATNASAPPVSQARGQDAAMQTERARKTDRPTRRREQIVEGAAREGLTAPEVLALAITALPALVGLGSMMLVLAII